MAMTQAQAWRGARTQPAGYQRRPVRQSGGRPGRLWAWLHAQELLAGPAGPAAAAALAEDDSGRLAARRTTLPAGWTARPGA